MSKIIFPNHYSSVPDKSSFTGVGEARRDEAIFVSSALFFCLLSSYLSLSLSLMQHGLIRAFNVTSSVLYFTPAQQCHLKVHSFVGTLSRGSVFTCASNIHEIHDTLVIEKERERGNVRKGG